MHSNQAGLEVMHNLFHTQANWARSATQPVFIHNKLAELEVITILY
jgi:Tat protein secretion system quality control protein TatD with DNase activity